MLIDSILNGFDIPKFYFHDFYPGLEVDGVKYRYAIIDGKQRLNAIWGFIDGDFALSADMVLVNHPETNIAGLTYSELEMAQPKIKARFDSRTLAVVEIQTDDTELIEEMFSRLNEAVPLSAAEKRNALRGPIPPVVRRLAEHKFFTDRVPFANSRYRHFDLICKFLLLSHKQKIVDLKKAYLDAFVIDFRHEKKEARAAELENSVETVLDRMAGVFTDDDVLLRPVGMLTLYFILYAGIDSPDWTKSVSRTNLLAFEQARIQNRAIAVDNVTQAKYQLLEFDRWAQSPNDAVALEYRYKVIRGWLARRNRAR